MTEFQKGLINDRWPLVLPDFRVEFFKKRPRWEKGRVDHMADRIEPGMHVVDVGSEHADFTALFVSWGAEVSLIEPSLPYWPCARATFEANGFGPPTASFVGFASGQTKLRGASVLNGWPDINGPVVADPGFQHLAQGGTIPQITLDDFAAESEMPDALTIDVEGAEWDVLSGAVGLFTTVKPLVWVSVHAPTMRNWYHRSLKDIIDLMDTVGYVGEELPWNGEGERFLFFEYKRA